MKKIILNLFLTLVALPLAAEESKGLLFNILSTIMRPSLSERKYCNDRLKWYIKEEKKHRTSQYAKSFEQLKDDDLNLRLICEKNSQSLKDSKNLSPSR